MVVATVEVVVTEVVAQVTQEAALAAALLVMALVMVKVMPELAIAMGAAARQAQMRHLLQIHQHHLLHQGPVLVRAMAAAIIYSRRLLQRLVAPQIAIRSLLFAQQALQAHIQTAQRRLVAALQTATHLRRRVVQQTAIQRLRPRLPAVEGAALAAVVAVVHLPTITIRQH